MKLRAMLPLSALLAFAAQAAHASTVDISIPYTSTGSVLYSNQWSNSPYQGPSIAAAPTNGNQGGPTFAYYAGQFNGTGSGNTSILTFTGLPVLGNASTVNALMNTFYGSYYTLDAVVTFTNSNGATESYDLIGAETIRDYYNNLGNNFSNLLAGNNALGDGSPSTPASSPPRIGGTTTATTPPPRRASGRADLLPPRLLGRNDPHRYDHRRQPQRRQRNPDRPLGSATG